MSDVGFLHQVLGRSDGERHGPDYTGTKALMMAILESGIRDYCGTAGRQSAEAQDWLWSNRLGAFSFAIICETLELEPTTIRQALVRMKEHGALRLARSRDNVRKKRPTAPSR